MDGTTSTGQVSINRWLPYCAVFQADVRQTMSSWVYRTWVLACTLAAVGYMLYRMGVHREAGIVQPASILMSDLLRWCVYGTLTLIIVLTAGSISSEHGTLADSVLSRGISRYQYFLGKWHARLVTILGTFLVMGLVALIGSHLLLHEDLSMSGSLIALLTVATILAAVISCGVTVSAVFSSTLVAVAVLWIGIYGIGFGLSFLPHQHPSPFRALNNLPHILRGDYNLQILGRLMGWSALISCVAAVFGMGFFSRRDV